MRDGVIEQIGNPDEIYNLPRNAFVADFVGSANLISGRHKPELDTDGLIAIETSAGGIVYGTANGRPVGNDVTVSIRTVHLRISLDKPAAARNVWPVRVERSVFQGDFTQVHVLWGEQRLVIRSAAMEPIAEGANAYMSADPRRVVVLET
jgi:ABC-type Fe3+/spermidine/putrescine transport system ATPase subunit